MPVPGPGTGDRGSRATPPRRTLDRADAGTLAARQAGARDGIRRAAGPGTVPDGLAAQVAILGAHATQGDPTAPWGLAP